LAQQDDQRNFNLTSHTSSSLSALFSGLVKHGLSISLRLPALSGQISDDDLVTPLISPAFVNPFVLASA
jgi:hypothetical protein